MKASVASWILAVSCSSILNKYVTPLFSSTLFYLKIYLLAMLAVYIRKKCCFVFKESETIFPISFLSVNKNWKLEYEQLSTVAYILEVLNLCLKFDFLAIVTGILAILSNQHLNQPIGNNNFSRHSSRISEKFTKNFYKMQCYKYLLQRK